MQGLMQRRELLISSIIAHAARHHAEGEIVSRREDGRIVRTSYAAMERRSRRLMGVLRDMGDRFAAKEALDWALSVYMAQLGPDHPTTKSVQRNRSLLG